MRKPREEWDLDLGDDHKLIWQLDKDGLRTGAIIEHLSGGQDHKPKGSYCAGGISWVPGWRLQNPWTLDGAADEHLTVSPSVLCSCGDHGFIRDGKWVKA